MTMCLKCRFTQIRNERDKDGITVHISVLTGLPHRCDYTPPFVCAGCGVWIYLDHRVLSRDSNKRRPLDLGSDTYHFCGVKQ